MTYADNHSHSKRASWRRLTVFSLIFIGMTAAGLYTVFDQFAERTITFDARLLEPVTLASIGLLLFIYFLMDGLRLHFTLRALGHNLPFGILFRLVFINLFFSNVTPMATGGGFAQIWYLNRQGVPLGRATAATTIRTLLAVVVIFTLTPIFLLTLDALTNHKVTGNIGVALAVFITLYLVFFAVLLFRTRWLIAPLSSLLNMLQRFHMISNTHNQRWQFRAKREMLRFSRSFNDYLHGRTLFVGLSILCTLGFLLSLFSFPALLMYSLGYDVEYLTSVGLLVVTTFIMYFSPTPGASGISEGVFGSFFHNILTGNHLLLVTVTWRFLTIYLGMIVGLIVLQRELLKDKGTPG